jgi:hypothetical protein
MHEFGLKAALAEVSSSAAIATSVPAWRRRCARKAFIKKCYFEILALCT